MNTLVIKDQVHKSPQKYIFFEKKVETLFLLSTLKKKKRGACLAAKMVTGQHGTLISFPLLFFASFSGATCQLSH